MNYYFVIISTDDTPTYELESLRPDAFKGEENGHMHRFIVHAALDSVDELRYSQSSGNSYYLKIVDRFNEWMVSAYLSPTGDRLMLLHDVKSEEPIRAFFSDAHELYARVTLNPFYVRPAPLTGQSFDARLRQLAKKHLG